MPDIELQETTLSCLINIRNKGAEEGVGFLNNIQFISIDGGEADNRLSLGINGTAFGVDVVPVDLMPLFQG